MVPRSTLGNLDKYGRERKERPYYGAKLEKKVACIVSKSGAIGIHIRSLSLIRIDANRASGAENMIALPWLRGWVSIGGVEAGLMLPSGIDILLICTFQTHLPAPAAFSHTYQTTDQDAVSRLNCPRESPPIFIFPPFQLLRRALFPSLHFLGNRALWEDNPRALGRLLGRLIFTLVLFLNRTFRIYFGH